MLERSIVVFFMVLFSLPVIHTVMSNIEVNKTAARQIEAASREGSKIITANAKHLKCLAAAVYHEAKGESTVGQIAVARVVMNRVLHGFGSNPCAVVYQSHTVNDEDGNQKRLCQFSWVCTDKGIPAENNASYQKAKVIAKQVLEEDRGSDLLPNNTLFFHNLTVAPRWAYKQVTTIGNHVFYSKGREKVTDNKQHDK